MLLQFVANRAQYLRRAEAQRSEQADAAADAEVASSLTDPPSPANFADLALVEYAFTANVVEYLAKPGSRLAP